MRAAAPWTGHSVGGTPGALLHSSPSSAGLGERKELWEHHSQAHQLGGLPPNSHLWGAPTATLQRGVSEKEDEKEANSCAQGQCFVRGEGEQSFRARVKESPQTVGDPDRLRASRPLERSSPHGGQSPSDVGHGENPPRVYRPHLTPPRGLHSASSSPAKILGPSRTQALPRAPAGSASLWPVHASNTSARTRPGCGLGSGQLVGSLQHLHEESVDGGVTNKLEEKQVL